MRVTRAIAVAIAAASLLALSAGAAAIKIKKTELPLAVREAVEHSAPGAHISTCWRLEGDGDAKYEVDLKVDGRRKGVVISADGKVLTVQDEITWEELPERVQERFKLVAGDHDIEELHSISQRGEVVAYEVRIDGDDGDFTYEVGPRGETLAGKNRFGETWRERKPASEEQQNPSEQQSQPNPPSR